MMNHNFENTRKFVIQPKNILVNMEKVDNEFHDEISNNDCHGITFNSRTNARIDDIVEISFNVEGMYFSGKGKIVRKIKIENGFTYDMVFLQCEDPFRIKMALQICQIKDFTEQQKKEKNVNKRDDAAIKWIKMNAAKF